MGALIEYRILIRRVFVLVLEWFTANNCFYNTVALPFLEFGNNSQSLENDRSDIVSEEIFIPNGFPFGKTVHTSAFVREY